MITTLTPPYRGLSVLEEALTVGQMSRSAVSVLSRMLWFGTEEEGEAH